MDTERSKPGQGRRAAGAPAKLLGMLRVLTRGDRRKPNASGQKRWFIRNSERGCRRAVPRRPLHLVSGKIVDENLNFLVECTLLDYSSGGCRLRLARDVPLPRTVHIYLDNDASIFIVSPVWRRGTYIGFRLVDRIFTPKHERPPIKWRSLGQRYYALR